MRLLKSVMPIRFNLFGGEGGGDGAATGEAQGAASVDTGRSKKTGETTKILYGKQPAEAVPDAGEQNTEGSETETANEAAKAEASESPEDRRKAFLKLINEQYKDEFTAETQRIIDRRFKQSKNMQSRLDAQQPLIEMLAERYGIEGGDIARITAAVENDTEYWSEAADAAGMSVEQYKTVKRLERENKRLLEEQRRAAGERQANAQLEQWYRDADAVRAQYPEFNLQNEVANEQFKALLRAGVPLEQAYKVIHLNDIITANTQKTAAETEKKVVDNVRAKGARPSENGASSAGAFVVKDDVSKLSKKDRAEIVKRVMRGEHIEF